MTSRATSVMNQPWLLLLQEKMFNLRPEPPAIATLTIVSDKYLTICCNLRDCKLILIYINCTNLILILISMECETIMALYSLPNILCGS